MIGFGQLLEELLKSSGVTQSSLADKTGLTQSAISHYIRGDREPRGSNLVRIADALGVTVDELTFLRAGKSWEEEIFNLKKRLRTVSGRLTLDEKMALIKCLFENEEIKHAE